MPKLIPDGPIVPAELIQKQQAGEMVFFCGAGISIPTGLPNFERLVQQLYSRVRLAPTPRESKMIDDGQFAEALDILEDRAPENAMRSALVRIFSTPPKPGSLRLHRALLQVSRNSSGMRLVTTNYDDNFARASDPKPIRIDAYPLLPKLEDWNSLVHVHGRIPDSGVEPDKLQLVLTGVEFTDAYIRGKENRAAEFVSDLLDRYTVVFVGYSMTDVVVGWLTKAFAKRRFAGRSYSLVGYADEKERDELRFKCEQNGIDPIFYQSGNEHELLVRTVEEWAKLTADPNQYRIRLAVSGLQRSPDKKTHEADPDRVLWALSDRAVCFPAVNRVSRTPVPGAYAAAWLQEFAARGLLGGTVQPKFHERGAAGPVVTLLAEQQMLQTDSVANAVAYWIEIHAHSPEVFKWVICHGRNIGFELRRRLWDRLTSNEDDLPEIPARLARLWSLLLAEPPEDAQFLLRLDPILNKLLHENTEAADDILLRLLRPRLGVFPGPAPYRLLPTDASEEDLALLSCGHTDVVLGCRDERHHFNVLTEIEPSRFGGFLERHSIALTEYLKTATAFTLLRRSDQMTAQSIYFELSNESSRGAFRWTENSVEISDAQETKIERRRSLSDSVGSWTILLDWVRQSYRALPEGSKDRDGLLRYWATSNEKMLWCLALEAIEEDDGANFELVRTLFGRNEQEMLWDADCNRQVLAILRQVGTRASSELKAELLDNVQNRALTPAAHSDSDTTTLVAIGTRLAALDEGGVILSSAVRQTLATFKQWEKAAGSLGPETSPVPLNGRIRDVAAALRAGSVDVVVFREFAERRPVAAMFALQDLGRGEEWPVEMWKVTLDVVRVRLQDARSRYHRAPRLADVLLVTPDNLFQCLHYEIARLVEVLAERWAGIDDNKFWSLWMRGWEARSHRASIRSRVDALTEAMNTTAGKYAAAAIKRISTGVSETSSPMTDKQMSILDQIAEDVRGSAGVVMLVFQLNWLYSNATNWTTEQILPRLRWERATQSEELYKEACALWGVIAFRGLISNDLVRVLGTDLWLAIQSHKSLDHGEKLVRFFIYVSVSPQTSLIHESTCEKLAPIAVRDSPLSVGGALRDVLDEYDQPNEQVWRDFVHPWLRRYWPNDMAFNTVTSSCALVQVIMGTGDAFPEAVAWASGYLIASNEPNDRQISKVWHHKDTWKSHPRATVALLHRIVPDVEIDTWQRVPLVEMLETLRELDATIPRDPKFVELERRAAR